ncbi:hypothetical protein GCM10007094_41470 [Pseudovibrio japonicus]|uniref:Xylose isomerase-like TIM barrel domain-containing protein n=1 Tax=Pseudovibrio japonicus TaxID=366534 RepID=A0ABQ3EN68_9HYPH|nr:sugar phosphate isomerase/epimerase [Pseudovibrio japonicus]GHB47865.1 hypothetical protein GCM10007094_41470 [Pseudovibrio japonicus]
MPEKLSVSAIAWPANRELEFAKLLEQNAIQGIEAVPHRVLNSGKTAVAYKRFWAERGIQICAMQALLYGAPPFHLFGGRELRDKMTSYLKMVLQMAGELEAKALVFGSPKQRIRGALDLDQAMSIAADFFHTLGEYALQFDTKICIEPNPETYGCDFVTKVSHAETLVNKVGSAGFGLHLDAGGMFLSKEKPESCLKALGSKICHFHISNPDLDPIHITVRDLEQHHFKCADSLASIHYDGWRSIEMKSTPNIDRDLISAINYARAIYYTKSKSLGRVH